MDEYRCVCCGAKAQTDGSIFHISSCPQRAVTYIRFDGKSDYLDRSIDVNDAIRAAKERASMEVELKELRAFKLTHCDCDKAFKTLMQANEMLSAENQRLEREAVELRAEVESLTKNSWVVLVQEAEARCARLEQALREIREQQIDCIAVRKVETWPGRWRTAVENIGRIARAALEKGGG